MVLLLSFNMRMVWRFLAANLPVNRALNRLLSGEVFGAIIHRRERRREWLFYVLLDHFLKFY